MKRYLIGNLIVDIEADCERLNRLGKPYETDKDTPADISINIPSEIIDDMQIKYPTLTRDTLNYMATGTMFFRKVTVFDAIMLHSSCIMFENKAYMFTADSGTGKSTHTALWKQVFGDKVTYINDDKPLLRKINGVWTAFGNPWSGKTDLNTNCSAPVGGIVFLNRGKENTIKKLNPPIDSVASLFMDQTVKPRSARNATAMLVNADDLLMSVPLFELYCNVSEEAVWTAYNAIVKED